MRLKVLRAFSWAHRYVEVVIYEAGQVIDTEDADLIRVAREEGWVELDDQNDDLPIDGAQQDDQVDGQQPAGEQIEDQPKTSRAKRATR